MNSIWLRHVLDQSRHVESTNIDCKAIERRVELQYIYIYISKYLVTDARHKKKEIINFCISGDGVLTSEKETIRERRERNLKKFVKSRVEEKGEGGRAKKRS